MHAWLNEKNQWIYPHLIRAQQKMTELVEKFRDPDPVLERALKQAGRELLLAQSSDWPFILRTGTSPDYARKRVHDHLLRFNRIYDFLTGSGGLAGNAGVSPAILHGLEEIESYDNLFHSLNFRYWLRGSEK